MADQFAQALLGKAEAPYRGGNGPSVAAGGEGTTGDDGDQSVLKSYDEAVAATERSEDADGDADVDTDTTAGNRDTAPNDTDSDAPADDSPTGETPTDDSSDGAPVDDVDPVTRADVAESALRFDDAVELGTREAVIEELRSRIEALPELSQGMLRHYRREGVSDPVAAHIDAGGDGDSGHAYSRHRPIRRAGVIRHAGRGHYAYAVPDLIREAYADRLDEESVREIVRAVETAFVPPAERSYPPDADPAEVGVGNGSAETDLDGEVVSPGEGDDSDGSASETEASADQPTSHLSDAARKIAERGHTVDE